MGLITFPCYYSPERNFLFAGVSSADYMLELASMPMAVPTIFLFCFGLLTLYYFKRAKKIKLVFLTVILLLWFLSGRTIGTILWPEGTIITGWFYIRFDKFIICNNDGDCETTISYHTKTEELSFWRVRVKNKNTDRVIFVGPFIWSRTLKLFNEQLGLGKYYWCIALALLHYEMRPAALHSAVKSKRAGNKTTLVSLGVSTWRPVLLSDGAPLTAQRGRVSFTSLWNATGIA